MLPGDLYFSFEHDFIDVFIELQCFNYDRLVSAHVKIGDHGEEFPNI